MSPSRPVITKPSHYQAQSLPSPVVTEPSHHKAQSLPSPVVTEPSMDFCFTALTRDCLGRAVPRVCVRSVASIVYSCPSSFSTADLIFPLSVTSIVLLYDCAPSSPKMFCSCSACLSPELVQGRRRLLFAESAEFDEASSLRALSDEASSNPRLRHLGRRGRIHLGLRRARVGLVNVRGPEPLRGP